MSGLSKTAKINLLVAILLLLVSVGIVYFVPRAKYTGKTIAAEILESIPADAQKWQGRDIEAIGNNLEGEVYNFISRVFARQYVNSSNPEEYTFLVILDAGNFHYPKVCFKGAGFSTEELSPRELNLQPGKIKAHLMLSKKKDEQLLSIYWICIDKKIVPTWAQQKIKQLYYSLFNKKRVGLMVRVDIPVIKDVNHSVETVKNFLNGLYQATPRRYRDYIFSDFNR